MDERELRHWIERVKDGTVTRRQFTRMMVGARADGAHGRPDAAPSAGVAQAQTKPAFTPTKRGGGGALKALWWQAPTLLNPHFAIGTKDQDGSRIFYEPLASFDPDGNLVPILAAEVPTRPERRRRQGRHCRSPGSSSRASSGTTASPSPPTTWSSTGSTRPTRPPPPCTIGAYQDIARIEKLDSHTVKVVFKKPDAVLGRRLLRPDRA